MEIKVREDFSLEKILKYRPFLFFIDDTPHKTIRIGNKKYGLAFEQKDNLLVVKTSPAVSKEVESLLKKNLSYSLGCSDNLSDFYTICRDDKVLKNFYGKIYGNRIISAFNDFEALACIICSQNVGFNQYKNLLLSLMEAYNEFPTPAMILNTNKINELAIGYKKEFLKELAKFMLFRPVVEDAYRLSAVKGIGPYSIDIFMLFQKRQFNYFYIDRLIKKIIVERYGADLKTDKEIRSFAHNKWKNFEGMAEVYLQKFINDV